MANERESMPGLEELQQAIGAGDAEAIRRAIRALTERELQVLEARLGVDEVRRITARARGATRGAKLGRVVVVHGIMGARLDSVDRHGDADRVWVNFFRLALGRIEDLKLAPDGSPANLEHQIRLAGLFPEYLSLITELAGRWEVLPFAFDWRKDIDDAADQLATRIREWSSGEPVHVVAHSMGGLVARRLAQRSPEVWREMADGKSLQRGGRLVMLGTPNRGSYAIPLVLTGEEKTVRLLQAVDIRHGQRELIDIIGTFLGCYQMLPSSIGNVPDDRGKLYDAATWGTLPVLAEHLERARAFQQALDAVTDPQRLVYVAGFDQSTPHRIRVDGAGEFRYQQTLDGDGRVSHELGLLEGVPTFWVRERHGALARNADVLAGIHDLLRSGTTDRLARERQRRRAAASPEWLTPKQIETVSTDLIGPELLPGAPRAAKAVDIERPADELSQITPEAAARVEALLLEEYLGSPGGVAATRGFDRSAPPPVDEGRRRRVPPKLGVQVRWGDITRATADVYAVGHYEGVLPQAAELALDRAISGADVDAQDLVLTRLTRRGMLRGALGEVHFYPIASAEPKGRVVAVAGMGHPGSFGAPELRRLARNLASAIMALPGIRRVCSVLIGGGTGNLPVSVAAEGLVLGFADALEAISRRSDVRELVIVEDQLEKAYQVHEGLEQLRNHPEFRARVDLQLAPIDLPKEGGGRVSEPFCFGLTLASAAAAAAGDASTRRALGTVLGKIEELGEFSEKTLAALRGIPSGGDSSLTKIAADIAIRLRTPRAESTTAPTRLSFVRTGRDGGPNDAIVAAALTDTVVMPERRLGVDPRLVDELVTQMIAPKPTAVPELSQLLAQLVIPRDFRDLISQGRPTILEVDRSMAAVHWELLASRIDGDATDGRPLGLVAPVARQLRTTYSPPPSAAPPLRWPLRALVIGDPGDPKEARALDGARKEALAVAELLETKGLEVEVLIGAPSVARSGELARYEPASRLTVLRKLLKGGYDLLHYAGHGDFDDHHPEVAGWLFEGGLLTSRELEHVDLAPRLVVANACLSSRTSNAYAGGAKGPASRGDANLLPGLADEFFRRGVRNYIGTAWPVDDEGAVKFAQAFYEALFPETEKRVALGDALRAAREALQREESEFGTLWAAYQHYGDPLQPVAPPVEQPGTVGTTAGGSAKRSRPWRARATEDGQAAAGEARCARLPAKETVDDSVPSGSMVGVRPGRSG